MRGLVRTVGLLAMIGLGSACGEADKGDAARGGDGRTPPAEAKAPPAAADDAAATGGGALFGGQDGPTEVRAGSRIVGLVFRQANVEYVYMFGGDPVDAGQTRPDTAVTGIAPWPAGVTPDVRTPANPTPTVTLPKFQTCINNECGPCGEAGRPSCPAFTPDGYLANAWPIIKARLALPESAPPPQVVRRKTTHMGARPFNLDDCKAGTLTELDPIHNSEASGPPDGGGSSIPVARQHLGQISGDALVARVLINRAQRGPLGLDWVDALQPKPLGANDARLDRNAFCDAAAALVSNWCPSGKTDCYQEFVFQPF